jgi:predicted transcriptional regulator
MQVEFSTSIHEHAPIVSRVPLALHNTIPRLHRQGSVSEQAARPGYIFRGIQVDFSADNALVEQSDFYRRNYHQVDFFRNDHMSQVRFKT